ncbi:hypothetical protein CQA49_06780 [Helicobacter sp. MIT 00-7814]|nr:hypothetical protein CQA49_06780 [Helicobacter sp. MIT 00-7814]RDU54167.1 hypothetical protein CQA37_06020 [Helicobacter sp. MIT 99-10781]
MSKSEIFFRNINKGEQRLLKAIFADKSFMELLKRAEISKNEIKKAIKACEYCFSCARGAKIYRNSSKTFSFCSLSKEGRKLVVSFEAWLLKGKLPIFEYKIK